MSQKGNYYRSLCVFAVFALEAGAQTASVTYRLDSSWNTGLQAGLVITNTGTATISNWTLAFDYPHNITSIWDAAIRSKSGTRYVIGGPSWNRNIAPGGQVWLGWVARRNGAVSGPTNCAIPAIQVQSGTCPAGSGGGTTTDTSPPAIPSNLRSTAQTTTSITLAWNASSDTGGSGLASYELQMNSAPVTATAQTQFTVSNLTPGTSYLFAVRAKDNAGNYSALSAALRVSTRAQVSCAQVPAIPTGLAVNGITSTSAQLNWNAVTPPAGCTISYAVWRNGAQVVSGIPETSYLLSGLQPGTSYSVAVAAADAVGSSNTGNPVTFRTADAPITPVTGFPPRVFAPYADMLLWPTPNLADIASRTGVKYFTAAFVVSGGGCQASWGGVVPVAQNFLVPEVAALRAAGGEVIVSFGGASGIELGQACTSVSSLQSQYQAVIDKFQLSRIDFDIEGGAVADLASVDRRNKAIAGLQSAARASGKTLTVQYTLPVLPTGLTADGVRILQNAVQNGVDIGVVNIMAMDYGNAVADPNRMGQAAIDAANSTFAQMRSIYTTAQKSNAQLRAMQGVTPMVGLNDVVPEVFTLSGDAPMLLNFAQTNGLGMLSMWSVGRDHPCPGSPSVSPTCSGVPQADWQFMGVFRPFSGQ